jgi:membrane protease YdiL (CAAX protease family)
LANSSCNAFVVLPTSSPTELVVVETTTPRLKTTARNKEQFTTSLSPSTRRQRQKRQSWLCLQATSDGDNNEKEKVDETNANSNNIFTKINSSYKDDKYFDIRVTVSLLAGQSALVIPGIVFALVLKIPNYGFGSGFSANQQSIIDGILYTIPLGIIGYLLDTVEDNFQPLKDVTTATQSSILNMLGSQFKPVLGLVAALILGLAAGIGEELLFRGVLQYQLSESLDSSAALAISSIIFGLLHAVTPLYALLATLASLYFGWLYLMSDNLVVPIATHAFYDFVALMCAHYTVTKMSTKEQEMLADWRMGSKKNKDDNVIL